MENKTGKYVKYAIGEIILVVIGILIALQINNNNEGNKLRAYELKMLSEVRQELIQDTSYFNMISSRADIAINEIDKIVELYHESVHNLDSMNNHVGGFMIGLQFSYHKGAYESIKSVGLDRISNDSIRMLMTDVYDFALPRNENLILDWKNRSEITFNELFSKVIRMTLIQDQNGNTFPRLEFKEKNWKNNQDLIQLIYSRRSSATNAKSRIQDVKDQCSKLISLIDKELDIAK